MDNPKKEFNDRLRQWLDTPQDERDYAAGAMLLLQLDGNKVFYSNVMRDPAKFAEHITYKLQRHLKFRLSELTDRQVREMSNKAEEIFQTYFPDKESKKKFRAGLRPDHDSLPDNIRQLYEQAMANRRKISECHMQARRIQQDPSVKCKSSELFPWVSDIIRLDKLSRELFAQYDSYGQPQ